MSNMWFCLFSVRSKFLRLGGSVGFAVLLMLAFGVVEPRASGACGEGDAVPSVVQEVAPGVFVRPGTHDIMKAENRGAIANVGFIVGSAAVAVVDTGGSACDGRLLRMAIRTLTDLPIAYVINTHAHPDHVFGNSAFREDAPEFVGHRNLPRALAASGPHYLEANRRIMGEEALAGTEILQPTVLVNDRLVLDLGGRVLQLLAHPTGHTDNDLSVFDTASGTLWTGDLVFAGHLPVVDGSLKGWLDVMNQLSELPAKRAVPGHGPVVVGWPGGLAAQKRYLTTLARDLRKLIAEGRSMNHAIEVAAESERGKWKLFDVFNARNASAGFAELEWE